MTDTITTIFEFEAQITQVKPIKKNEYLLEINPNYLHPSGGGQPGDRGKISSASFKGEILNCIKEDKTKLLHIKTKQQPKPKDSAYVIIDKSFRHKISKMHTGEHILSRILENMLEGFYVYKVNIDPNETTIYAEYKGNLNWQIIAEAEKQANQIIDQALPVNIYYLTKNEAQKIKNLKANWGRIKQEKLRIVEIPNFDIIACSGTHLKNTKDVNGIFITSFKKGLGKDQWEIKFKTDVKKHYLDYSLTARILSREIGCEHKKLLDVFRNLQQENKDLKKLLNRVKEFISIPWQKEALNPYILHTPPDILHLDKSLLTPIAKKLIDQQKNAIALILIEQDNTNFLEFILCAGEETDINLKDFIKNSKDVLKIKGGGSPKWINGITYDRSKDKWLKQLKEFIISSQNTTKR